MKVHYISSACVLIEHEGTRVLCDPWLTDGIYYGSWHHHPPLQAKPEDFNDVDYIYVTHVHPDHLDPASMKRISKSIPILIHDYADKFLPRILGSLGFEKVTEVPHRTPVQLAPNFRVEILAADDCDPEAFERFYGMRAPDPYERTAQVDSLGIFHGSGKTVVNANDSHYAVATGVCDYIVDKYKSIDLVLAGYGGAGPYPQCFENLDEASKREKGREKKANFLNQAVSYLKHLRPSFYMPFAGEYTLGGKLAPLNDLRGLPEREDLPTDFAPLSDILLDGLS